MSLRSDLSGTFTLEELRKLTWPVAWSPTKDQEEAEAEEAALHDLVGEAREALQRCYDASETDDAEFSVVIEAGEVVDFVES